MENSFGRPTNPIRKELTESKKQVTHHRVTCLLVYLFTCRYTCGKFLRITFNIPKLLTAPCTTQVIGLSTR